MNDKRRIKVQAALLTLVIMLPIAAMAFLLSDRVFQGAVVATVVMVAGLVGTGLTFHRAGVLIDRAQRATQLAQQKITDVQSTAITTKHLYTLLADLSRMQNGDDLAKRYLYFTNLVQRFLEESLGPCTVSFWSPDEDDKHLVECVIQDSGAGRKPSRAPLKSPMIKEAIRTGTAYQRTPNTPAEGRKSAVVKCDACIPLMRRYGRPLLVVAQQIGASGADTPLMDFDAAVNFITLIWEQLQATNQRQWAVEHEEHSGVMRDDVFLTKAQEMVDKAEREADLFTIVTITVRGFRGMFIEQAPQWRAFSGIVSRSIIDVLKQKDRPFFLGRMADDVFALALPQTDAFLAQSVVQQVTRTIEESVALTPVARTFDAATLEMAWICTDQKSYSESVEQTLIMMYQQLFAHDNSENISTHAVALRDAVEETVD